jgi:hypothetical protein
MAFHLGLSKVLARTKAEGKMGRVKQFMRGLRSRLSPSKTKASDTSGSLAAASPRTTNEQCKSPFTLSMLPTSANKDIPPVTQRTTDQEEDVEDVHSTEDKNLDGENTLHRRPALAPLRTSSSRTARNRSSESFPYRPLPAIDERHSVAPELRQARSYTLSLSSDSSTSTWSFACRSARRIEREHEGSGSDSGSSFGSLGGWGVTIGDDGGHEQASGEAAREDIPDVLSDNTPPSESSRDQESDDFDLLPDWADVEDDADYNVRFVRDSDMWSITSIASSDAAQMADALVMPAGDARGMVTAESSEKKRMQDGEEETPSKRRKLEGTSNEVVLASATPMRHFKEPRH